MTSEVQSTSGDIMILRTGLGAPGGALQAYRLQPCRRALARRACPVPTQKASRLRGECHNAERRRPRTRLTSRCVPSGARTTKPTPRTRSISGGTSVQAPRLACCHAPSVTLSRSNNSSRAALRTALAPPLTEAASVCMYGTTKPTAPVASSLPSTHAPCQIRRTSLFT